MNSKRKAGFFMILLIISFVFIQITGAQTLKKDMVTGDGELRAKNYLTISKDGAWCWFSDPRAVYFKGRYERLYAGWTTSTGDVVIGSYNYRTKKITSKII